MEIIIIFRFTICMNFIRIFTDELNRVNLIGCWSKELSSLMNILGFSIIKSKGNLTYESDKLNILFIRATQNAFRSICWRQTGH